MAKLKGPLFSLGAAGAIGEALVYFPWKGLNVVREYVIPSNPKTTKQQTQRGYLTAAVAQIHAQQSTAINPLDADDIIALALWGSTYPTPRTWFNQLVKNFVDQLVADKSWLICRNFTLTPGALKITLKGEGTGSPNAPTSFDIWWGTSKTALINKQTITLAELRAGEDITGMPAKTKIFIQARTILPAAAIGGMSGIYYNKTL